MSDQENEKPVVLIGMAGLDMVGRISEEPEAATSTPGKIRVAWGGVSRNIAENLARLGQPVILLSAVGDDFSGDALCRHLHSAGVDTTRIQRVNNAATGAYLAVLDSRGTVRMALDDMRVIESVTPEYIETQSEIFRSASLLFLDANLPANTIRAALRLAKEHRLTVAADPVSRSLAARIKAHLKEFGILFASAREAGAMLGRELAADRPEQAVMAARELVAAGVRTVIVALEEFGVAYAHPEGSGHIPALRTPIVDPTGASDALTAAVIFGLTNDIPFDESVKLGVAAAALTVRSAQSVTPELSVEKLYAELM